MSECCTLGWVSRSLRSDRLELEYLLLEERTCLAFCAIHFQMVISARLRSAAMTTKLADVMHGMVGCMMSLSGHRERKRERDKCTIFLIKFVFCTFSSPFLFFFFFHSSLRSFNRPNVVHAQHMSFFSVWHCIAVLTLTHFDETSEDWKGNFFFLEWQWGNVTRIKLKICRKDSSTLSSSDVRAQSSPKCSYDGMMWEMFRASEKQHTRFERKKRVGER